jgi:hypothetical protein
MEGLDGSRGYAGQRAALPRRPVMCRSSRPASSASTKSARRPSRAIAPKPSWSASRRNSCSGAYGTASPFPQAKAGLEARIRTIAVAITGEFSRWTKEGISLKNVSEDTWQAVLDLASGRHEYRLVVDGEWRDDPEAKMRTPNSFGTQNCVLTATSVLPFGARGRSKSGPSRGPSSWWVSKPAAGIRFGATSTARGKRTWTVPSSRCSWACGSLWRSSRRPGGSGFTPSAVLPALPTEAEHDHGQRRDAQDDAKLHAHSLEPTFEAGLFH